MDMYNVLEALQKIENPTEDQKAAIKSAKMADPQNIHETSSTGDNIYAQYGKDDHADLIRLADVPVLNVVHDTPETIKEGDEDSKYHQKGDVEKYQWGDINQAMMDAGMSSTRIANVMSKLQGKALKEETIEEAQSPAQKAAFQKMLDKNKGKTDAKDEDKKEEEVDEACDSHKKVKEAGVTDAILKGSSKLPKGVVEDDADADAYAKNEKVSEEIETIELDEAYDAKHVAGIVAGHEKQGNKVEMDRPEMDGQGFTVTFKDGSRRHYHYSQAKTKVDNLEPVDPLVDPNAPKRERGRPKKEGLGEEESNVIDTAFVTMEGEETDPLTAMFEAKLNESVKPKFKQKVDEAIQVVQHIDDSNAESVSVNAQGQHVDMLKTLLNLSGQRSDGYDEYQGQEVEVPTEVPAEAPGEEEYAVEAEEREPAHANTPDEQLADVETQLNVMAGGVNQPRDRRVRTTAKSDSNKLYNKPASAVTNEAITDEKMMDLYKAYKGSE